MDGVCSTENARNAGAGGAAVCEAVVREIGRPVHISECEELFGSDLPSRALFGLALRDPKFEITPDRHLKLAEWRSANHEGRHFNRRLFQVDDLSEPNPASISTTSASGH